jgi:hypothetical protein
MLVDNKVIVEEIKRLSKLFTGWNDQLVIGGGVALILYDVFFSKSPSGAVGTLDIDYLIPRKPMNTGDRQISTILLTDGYEVRTKSLDTHPVQSFIKQIGEVEIELEFLTDAKARKKEDVVNIPEAGLNAQALSYLEMSLSEAMPVTLEGKIQVNVVKPEAWIFHKGLTFPRRVSKQKTFKDLYGIWFVLTQLGEASIATRKLLKSLMKKQPPAWERAFESNLKAWVANATPRDWVALEGQDPSGSLTNTNFLDVLNSLLAPFYT